MRYIGIDPGKRSGGIAWLDVEHRDGETLLVADAAKMPFTERDTWLLIAGLDGERVTAYIERVGAMPKQGVSSTFKFGQHYGMLRGMVVAAGIPFEAVSPGVWQRSLGCLSKGDKNVTKAKAQELFPHLKMTHAIADALLIAEYGRRVRT